MPEPLNSFISQYADPALIECNCMRCGRGGRCDWMADMWATHDNQRDYEAACSALTADDVAWLRAHGWPDADSPHVRVTPHVTTRFVG